MFMSVLVMYIFPTKNVVIFFFYPQERVNVFNLFTIPWVYLGFIRLFAIEYNHIGTQVQQYSQSFNRMCNQFQ